MRSKKTPKIAFIILAHNDEKLLKVFVKQLLNYSGSYIYIHIDKKSVMNLSLIPSSSRIKYVSNPVDVAWGDYSQIRAVIELMKSVISNEENDFDYVSLHSGVDLAIKPVSEFADYLYKNRFDAYLDCNPLPISGWGHGGGLERIGLKYPKIFRKKTSTKNIIRYARSIYQKLYESGVIKGQKLPENIDFYGGSVWFTISYKVLRDTISYIDTNPDYTRIFIKSLVADEIFFNTLFALVCNPVKLRMNDNLRFINWNNTNTDQSGAPRTLLSLDLEDIASSKNFFARKFSSSLDPKIIRELEDL